MKKIAMFTVLVVMALTLMSAVAMAGGWTTFEPSTTVDGGATHDPNDALGQTNVGVDTTTMTAVWQTGNSPHGNFSTSTNKCRVCHAVHGANTDSWRLLGGTTEGTECNACHGPYGVTKYRPWAPKSYTIKGEHTIGATAIPDAAAGPYATIGGAGLTCNTCHSVHGAGTFTIANAPDWGEKILRADPNKDGINLADGFAGAGVGGLSLSGDNIADNVTGSDFCADCHNKNPNFNAADVAGGMRANPRSHVQGAAADGTMLVRGISTQVAGYNAGLVIPNNTAGSDATTEVINQDTVDGCTSCHAAGGGTEVSGASLGGAPWGESAFPHQSMGSKLLFDSFSAGTADVSGTINDAQRVIPNMDELCARCHRNDATLGVTSPGASTAGVGVTF